MHYPTNRTEYITAFDTPVVEHCLERELAQWVHHEVSIRRLIILWADALPRSYISLLIFKKKIYEEMQTQRSYKLTVMIN